MNNHDIFEHLRGLTVRNLHGESIEIDSLWNNRRVVIAFLRHFG